MANLIVLSWIVCVFVELVAGSNSTREGRLFGFRAYFNYMYKVTYTATIYPTCYATLPSATLCTTSTSTRRKKQMDYFLDEPIPFFASPPFRVEETALRGKHGRNEIDFAEPWPIPLEQTEIFPSFQAAVGQGRGKQTNDKARILLLNNAITTYPSQTLYKTKILLATTTGPTVTYTVGCTPPSGYPTPICSAKTCTSNSDCPYALPSCVNKVCIRCTSNSQCASPKGYCIVSTGICSECLNNVQCVQLYPNQPACNVTTGTCVGCVTNVLGCFPPTEVCDGTTNQCRGCNSNQECVDVGGAGPTCQGGICV